MSETYLSETCGMVYFIRPDDTPEYLEELRKRGFITVSFKIDEAVENEYANVVVTSIDTTTDPNNWADGPMYPVNWPESVDTTPQEYKLVLVEGEPGEPLKLVPVVDTTDISVPQSIDWEGPNYPVNWPESTDTTPHEYKVVFVDSEPLRMIPATDTPIAFISTVDAETEAVTSVQVACADDGGWRTIGTLNNPDGIDWKYQAGNLTGSGTASVVWHAQELGALGVWTDGTDNWTGIAGWFDANWTMLGCGDFDGDGKDSVLMSLSGGQFYSVDLDGTLTSLGGLNWSGWEFGAVGDFAGDGKDDIVLFNKGLNCVVLLADGNADTWTALGTIDSSDWAIAGAGDFNSDGIDDLLVRQDSTGLIGGYAGADMNQWSVIDTTGEYYLA